MTEKYRDRPADEGKHGDAAEEPNAGVPSAPSGPPVSSESPISRRKKLRAKLHPPNLLKPTASASDGRQRIMARSDVFGVADSFALDLEPQLATATGPR